MCLCGPRMQLLCSTDFGLRRCFRWRLLHARGSLCPGRVLGQVCFGDTFALRPSLSRLSNPSPSYNEPEPPGSLKNGVKRRIKNTHSYFSSLREAENCLGLKDLPMPYVTSSKIEVPSVERFQGQKYGITSYDVFKISQLRFSSEVDKVHCVSKKFPPLNSL